MKKFLLLMVVAALTACANTNENLARETAREIGGITGAQVQISNVKRGVTSVSWTARTPKGIYDCEADDMVRRVNAVQR